MAHERYYFRTPTGEIVLNGTYRPSELRMRPQTPALYRARNQRRIIIMSDGLPDPAPIILNGQEKAVDEDALSIQLDALERDLLTATQFSRDRRRWYVIQWLTLTAVARTEGGSEAADVVLTIIAETIQTADESGLFF